MMDDTHPHNIALTTRREVELPRAPPLGMEEAKHIDPEIGMKEMVGPDMSIKALSQRSMSTVLGKPRTQVFEWNVVEYSVPTRRGKKTILQNIAGRVESGSFTAILGPSGSGKTTLIDCLALRNRDFIGALRLDGQPLTGHFFTMAAYVHQSELFFTHLTAREHLVWHAITRMGGLLTRQQCYDRVDEVMEDVNLTAAGNTFIGGGPFEFTKGLSGGEKKRLAIATELLSDPSILFLDEPTSGLDAVMGELVVLMASSLAQRDPKRIVLAALHTPSSRMYQMFTHMLILTSGGEMAYHGTKEKLLPFLEGMGHVCPERFNPADFILELVSYKKVVEHQGVEVMGEHANLLEDNTAYVDIVQACRQHMTHDQTVIPPDNSHEGFQRVAGGNSSSWLMFTMNLWRSWLSFSREVIGLVVLAIMTSILGVIFGLLYFRQVEGSWRNTVGLLFSLVVSIMIGATVQTCMIFPMDFKIVVREYYQGCNGPVPYFLGRNLAGIPFSLIYMFQAIIPYWLAGLVPEAVPFFWFCLVIWLLIMGSQSLGYLASSFSSNPLIGLAITPVLVTPMILFSGFLYERSSVNAGLAWIQDLSLANYSFGLLIINQCRGAKGMDMLMSFLQVHFEDFNKYLFILVALAIGYRMISLVVLRARIRFVKPM